MNDRYYGRGAYEAPLWQEGGAIRGYAGREHQYGAGLGSFGRVLWRLAKPILGYLGKKTLKTGVALGGDVLEGENIKAAAVKRLKETGSQLADDAATVVKKRLTGKGKKKNMARRRRRAEPRKQVYKKTRRRPAIKKRRTTRRRRVKALKDIFT